MTNIKTIKIAYLNFWNDPFNHFYFDHFITNNFNCNLIKVHFSQNPDILIASLQGNINIIDNINAKCKIFYYGENLNTQNPPYNNIDFLKTKFNIIAGFKYTNKKEKIFRFPLWLMYYPFYNFNQENNIINYIENKYLVNIKQNKYMFGTLVSGHDRGGQRKIIYDLLSKYNKVYCPGSVCNNTNKIGNHQNDKINYIKHSLYNICPENSIYEGYTTEKIFQAFEAGTIPLYWGHDLPEKDILNKNKYCFCNVEDINTLKQQIEDVVSYKMKYIEGKIFNDNAKNIIETYYNDLIEEIQKYL